LRNVCFLILDLLLSRARALTCTALDRFGRGDKVVAAFLGVGRQPRGAEAQEAVRGGSGLAACAGEGFFL